MAEKNRSRLILRNAVSNYARQVAQILVFLLLTPYIVSKVGSEDFGLWSLIQAVVGLLGLVDMGFSTSVVKYVADARGRGDTERLGDLTATFFWQYAGLGAVLGVATLLLAPMVPGLLGVAAEDAAAARGVFLLIGLRAAQGLPLGLFAGILVGFQKQVVSNATRTLGTLSYGIAAWWALGVSPDIGTLAHASLWTGLGANLLAAALCLRNAPGVSLAPRRFRRGLLREISSFSLWFFLIQVSILLATRVDTIVVNAYLPLAAVALYAVAMRVAEQAATLCRQMVNSLTPMIAELKGAGEDRNVRAVLLKGSMLSVAGSTPVLLGLGLLAEPLLAAWMGEEYRSAAVPCQLLLAAAFVSIVHGNTENVLTMTGKQRFLALSQVGLQGLNLTLTLLLIVPLGLFGVALATLASTALVKVWVQWKTREHCGVEFGRFYAESVGPSLAGAVACAAVVVGGWRVLGAGSLPVVAALLASGCAAFAPAFWFAGLSAKDREYFGGKLRAAAARRRPAAEVAA